VTDEPSASLDAAILAAARAVTARATSAPTTPTPRRWWTRWQPLAAAAGVAGLAFAMVQMLPREADVPAAPSVERAIERVVPGRSESTTPESAAAPRPAPREADAEHPAVAKRASPAASAPQSLPSTGASTGAEARDVAGAAAEANASSEQSLRQLAAPDGATTTPEAWARRIETLHDAGEKDAAAEALQAFRTAYPDADQYLAESLWPWAAAVGDRPAQAKEPAGITP
jgi:hypothetical protein